jgi:isochorismatase family protein
MSKEIVSNVSYPVAPGTTVLVSIDCQFGFGAGSWEQVPHADAAVENFRKASRADGTKAAEPYPDLIADGDLVVYKTTFSAVLSSDLPAQLRARHADTVVVGGLTTPICVQTTVDALSMTGFKVIVLADACASQAIGALSAEQAHMAAIQRMAYLFAAVEDTEAFVGKVRALQPAAG